MECHNSLELLNPEQVAQFLDLSTATLARYRCRGTGPRFIKFGNGIRYRRADLMAWLDGSVRQGTGDGQ